MGIRRESCMASMKNNIFHAVSRISRVATVRENYLENEIFSRSGKSQGILWMVREIEKGLGKSGKSQGI